MNRRSFLQTAASGAMATQAVSLRAAGGKDAAPIVTAATREFPRRQPLKPDLSRSLTARCLAKPVRATLVVDDMARDLGWRMQGPGSVGYASKPVRSGRRSMTVTFPKRDEDTLTHLRQQNGSFDAASGGVSTLGLDFATPQDWSGYTRLSMWVFVHPKRSRNHAFYLRFVCDGASEAGPTDLAAWHFFQDLVDGEWQQLVWEFPDLKRDRVMRLEIANMISGIQSGEAADNIYSVDRIEVQAVDVEPYEGWQPSPGKIAYQHVGYEPADRKVAIAAQVAAERFQLLDAPSSRVVAEYPIAPLTNARGRFSVLDFTPFTKPGRYKLRCAGTTTAEFPIAGDVWAGPIDKVINFFYMQRCGYDVPGVHDVCHQDLQGRRGAVVKGINGGWHDAGDTCQGSFRTNLAIHAMLEAAEQIERRRSSAKLYDRLLEEARWGIDWSLKTRFGDGFRIIFETNRFWTDNIVGGDHALDDTIVEATQTPEESFIFAMMAANAARVLATADPVRAAKLRPAAIEDYRSATRQVFARTVTTRDEAAFGTIAALALARLTGEAAYRDDAARLGKALIACQERRTGPDGYLTGWYYTDTSRRARNHDAHASFEEAPALAFAKLCEQLPDHPDWASWHAGALIHSEHFFGHGAGYAEPFRHLPNSVWDEADLARLGRPQGPPDGAPQDAGPPAGSAPAAGPGGPPGMPPMPAEMLATIVRQTREQFEAGTPLGAGQRLRIFPIWPPGILTGVLPPLHFQGSTAIHLAGTAALAVAARLRGSRTAEQLARAQLQWVFGGNPFSQTLMYGEGHDYQPLWAAISQNMVGALPVGINSRSHDAPYWPAVNHFTFKEQWVVPAAKFLLTMSIVGQPALVEGNAPAGARFVAGAGATVAVKPGAYRILLPAGDYVAEFGGARLALGLVGGSNHRLDLDPARHLHLALDATSAGITLVATGRGNHQVALRGWNATLARERIDLSLSGAAYREEIAVRPADPAMPWVVTAIPDGDVARAMESFAPPPPRPA